MTTIFSVNPTPPNAKSRCFDESHYQNATLYVQKESLEAYKATDVWNNFQNIQGIDVTEIKGIEADENNKQDVYYDLSGRKLNAPKKGLNIINGKKVIVK